LAARDANERDEPRRKRGAGERSASRDAPV
jgi:hypothetical protein